MAEHLFRQVVPDDISILCDLDQIARSSSDRRSFIQDAVQNNRAWVVEICDRIIGYGVISHGFFGRSFRYQTTIPDPVRKALGLNKRDKICYTIQPNGKVSISRVDQTENDPVLGKFLNFLARDIEKNPQHLQAISSDLVSHVQSLVAGVDLDLDAPLLDEDE